MIPELEAIIKDLEDAMRGPCPERTLPKLLVRTLRELQQLRDAQARVEADTHQHLWNAIHKIADANGVAI
jgi:predicted nucleic acid-binding Zn ribbon protein